MKYLVVTLLAALTALSQINPRPTATLKEGGICGPDKHDPDKLNCRKSSFVLSIDRTPRVSLIDSKGPKAWGLKSQGGFNPAGRFVVSLPPGPHTVQMSFFEHFSGSAPYVSEPSTVSFTAVPGHTYAASALASGSRLKGPTRWAPIIYDETDNRVASALGTSVELK
jgi:hypothetical protein